MARARVAACRHGSARHGIIRFFAHSISPASSLRAMNLCGGGSAFASDAISGAFDGRTSGSGSPVCRSHRRPSCDSAAAWNVRASTPWAPRRARRCFEFARRLLGERHRQDLLGGEGPGGHLMGDAMRDGRGLARARRRRGWRPGPGRPGPLVAGRRSARSRSPAPPLTPRGDATSAGGHVRRPAYPGRVDRLAVMAERTPERAGTIGELRASGYPDRTVKEELRAEPPVEARTPARTCSRASWASTTRCCPRSNAGSSPATT